jgi:hypothetical protein
VPVLRFDAASLGAGEDGDSIRGAWPNGRPPWTVWVWTMLVLLPAAVAGAGGETREGVDEGVIWAFWRKTCSRGILVGVNMERG